MKDSPAPVQSSDLNEQFIEALQKGLKDSALRIMNEADFDADAEEGLPLKTAIEFGYLDIATRLLGNGANPNAAQAKQSARSSSHWRMSISIWPTSC